jgi:hypothetical protein
MKSMVTRRFSRRFVLELWGEVTGGRAGLVFFSKYVL